MVRGHEARSRFERRFASNGDSNSSLKAFPWSDWAETLPTGLFGREVIISSSPHKLVLPYETHREQIGIFLQQRKGQHFEGLKVGVFFALKIPHTQYKLQQYFLLSNQTWQVPSHKFHYLK